MPLEGASRLLHNRRLDCLSFCKERIKLAGILFVLSYGKWFNWQ